MRRDTSFSNEKLTTEEFSKKYWLDGDAPYQYHTMNIEDGRDEREQLIINNIRAIWNKLHSPYTLRSLKNYERKLKEEIEKNGDLTKW